jgi:hypothetical protein
MRGQIKSSLSFNLLYLYYMIGSWWMLTPDRAGPGGIIDTPSDMMQMKLTNNIT